MRFPGSFGGDSEYDLAGPNRQLERVRNRMQDHFTGDEAAQHALAEAGDASRRPRAAQRPALRARLRVWWARHFPRTRDTA